MNDRSKTIRLSFEDLRDLVFSIFLRHGCSRHVASILADNCTGAERDGCYTHGLYRLQGYIDTLKSGWVDGKATPIVEARAPGFLRINAQNGFCQPALAAGAQDMMSRASTNGIAIGTIYDSHHFGPLAPDVELFVDEGFLAIAIVNSNCELAPAGGSRAVYGTNPIAFGAPRERGAPIIFDQATSNVANGEVRLAARDGRILPDGTGIDRHGAPTGDPHAILDGGALLPYGGYKGTSLALMVEILCAGLGGGNFTFEVAGQRNTFPGAQSARTGETVIVIDPRVSPTSMSGRIEGLLEAVTLAGQSRLPGEHRMARRAQSISDGIEIDRAQLDQLRAWSKE